MEQDGEPGGVSTASLSNTAAFDLATATVRVVVVPLEEPQGPLAVDDQLTVEPGRTATYRPLANDFVTDEAFVDLLRAWFGNIGRVLFPGRAAYIWGGYANCANYPPVLKACEMYFSQAIIWVKQHAVLCRKDFLGNHEWAFYGWREGA